MTSQTSDMQNLSADSSEVGVQPVEPDQPEGFGAALRRAREAEGLAIGDMVGRLRISVKQLRALESENVEDLPEAVYVRGFIRAYAKALNVDSQALVDDFNHRFAPADAPAAHQIPDVAYSNEEVFQDRMPSRWWRLAAVSLVVVAVVAGIWALTTQNKPEELVAEQLTDTAVSSNVQVTTPKTAVTQPAAPVVPTIPGVTISADDGSTVAPSDALEVRIRLRTVQSCWVRISRIGDDRTVFEQEIPTGSVRIVRSNKPLRVILGNPTGVGMEINGTDFDFKSFVSPKDGTARFRLH